MTGMPPLDVVEVHFRTYFYVDGSAFDPAHPDSLAKFEIPAEQRR